MAAVISYRDTAIYATDADVGPSRSCSQGRQQSPKFVERMPPRGLASDPKEKPPIQYVGLR
jgi:hypothetical protein